MSEQKPAGSSLHVNHDHIFQSKNGGSNASASEPKDIGILSKNLKNRSKSKNEYKF